MNTNNNCVRARALIALAMILLVAPTYGQNDKLDPVPENKGQEIDNSKSGSIFLLPQNVQPQPSVLYGSVLNKPLSEIDETQTNSEQASGINLDEILNFRVKKNVGVYGLLKLPEGDPSELEDKPLVLKPSALPEDQSLIDSLLNTNYVVGSRWGLTDRTSVNVEWEREQSTDNEKVSAGLKVQLD